MGEPARARERRTPAAAAAAAPASGGPRRNAFAPEQEPDAPAPLEPLVAGADRPAPDDAGAGAGAEVQRGAAHEMNFHAFVEALKAVHLVPRRARPRPGEGEGPGSARTDMASAEHALALEAFRAAANGASTLQWRTFRLALHHIFTSGAGFLACQRAEAEAALRALRVQLAHLAPVSRDPLADLREGLRARFESVHCAFVFFDMQGDWRVTRAEVRNMLRRLSLALTATDVELALNALFLACPEDGITAPPPLPPSRTNWTRLVPPPVLIGHVSSGRHHSAGVLPAAPLGHRRRPAQRRGRGGARGARGGAAPRAVAPPPPPPPLVLSGHAASLTPY